MRERTLLLISSFLSLLLYYAAGRFIDSSLIDLSHTSTEGTKFTKMDFFGRSFYVVAPVEGTQDIIEFVEGAHEGEGRSVGSLNRCCG
jgi:hypothetical protein